MTEHAASQPSTAGWAGEGLLSSLPSWCHELLSSTLSLLTQHYQPQLIRMDLSLTQSSPKSPKSFPLRLEMWLHQHWEHDSHTTTMKELGLVNFFWGRDAMGWFFSFHFSMRLAWSHRLGVLWLQCAPGIHPPVGFHQLRMFHHPNQGLAKWG